MSQSARVNEEVRYDPPSFSSGLEKEDNWPPCYPIVYHDRSSCGEKSPIATLAWFLYLGSCVLTFFNAFASIHIMVGSNFKPLVIPTAVVSSASVFLNPIVGIIIVYFPIYTACSKSNSLRYAIGILATASMLLNCFIWALGIPVISCGIISAYLLEFFGYNDWIFQFYSFTLFGLWVALALGYAVILYKLFGFFRRDGCTVDEAFRDVKKTLQKTSLTWQNVLKAFFT